MGRLKKILEDRSGFTLLELMVSLVIMAFGMLGVVGMFVTAIGGNAEGRNLSRATRIASQKIEELKLTTYANLTSNSAGTYSPSPDSIFKTSYWTTRDPDLNMRNVTVKVTWSSKGVNHEINLSSEIAKH